MKAKLYRLMSYRNSKHYIDALNLIVENYNLAPQRGLLNHSPTEILQNGDLQSKLFEARYKKEFGIHRPTIFKLGDYVVTALNKKSKLKKGYSQNFSHDVYQIAEVNPGNNVPLFKLKNISSGKLLPSRWYAAELIKVPAPTAELPKHLHV